MFNPASQSFWHQHHPGAMRPPFFPHGVPAGVPLAPQIGVPVRTVWAANLDAETAALRGSAARARFVAFAVHYPGVVAHGGVGGGADHNTLTVEQRYAAVKANVDALKPLQVGVAVGRGGGTGGAGGLQPPLPSAPPWKTPQAPLGWRLKMKRERGTGGGRRRQQPPFAGMLASPLAVGTHDGRCLAWEFNLSGFDAAASDPHAPGSVEYLERRGMDLGAHRAHGIPMARLTRALHRCGLLRRAGLSWVAYAGAYHAAYLMKIITGGLPLPGDVAAFLGAMQQFIGGDVYDVARMIRDCPYMPVGLERVAGSLGLAPPVGPGSPAPAPCSRCKHFYHLPSECSTET